MTIPFFGQPTEKNLKKYGKALRKKNKAICNCQYYNLIERHPGVEFSHRADCPCFRG